MALCHNDCFRGGDPRLITRREMLRRAGAGFGLLALSGLLGRDQLSAAATASGPGAFTNPLAPKPPHFAPKARSVIWLFQEGGPSGFDLFDPKPALDRYPGKRLATTIEPFFGNLGPIMRSPYTFKQYGQSGTWVANVMPHTSRIVDELCLLKACRADSNSHAPAMYQMNTGFTRPGFPSAGAWTSYGLGSENQDLPAFVVMPKTDGTKGGALNWGAGFLPGSNQGTLFRSGDNPILNLRRPADVTDTQQRRQLDLLRELNETHAAGNPAERDLEARIASYELAYKMQFAASEAVNLTEESAETKALYGIDQERSRDYGSKLLLARRLVERGVRFIQAYPNEQWDAHGDLKGNHGKLSGMTDQPVAGLITDLKRRGLLDTTLVIWGGEFGRLPQSQGTNGGRDHNPEGFLMWMAGGGVRAGYHHGATDEIGHRGAVDPVSVPDVHATILHLLGLDHKRLTYLHNGRNFRLTDVSGEVINKIVA